MTILTRRLCLDCNSMMNIDKINGKNIHYCSCCKKTVTEKVFKTLKLATKYNYP